jgi:hypothetical protein
LKFARHLNWGRKTRSISQRRAQTQPPIHDAASAWNAGFIRQVCNRRGLLPDKSGVPVVVSMCARQRMTENAGEFSPTGSAPILPEDS